MSKSTRADGSNTRQLSGSTYRAEKDLSDSAAIALGSVCIYESFVAFGPSTTCLICKTRLIDEQHG